MLKVIYTGFGLLAAGVLAALFYPHARLWGLHFLSYYPAPMQIVFVALAALTLGIGFVRLPWRRGGAKPPAAAFFSPLQWDILTALLCGMVFLWLSSATALLGDGQIWLNEIRADTSDYAQNRAPLTLYLLHALYNWLNPLTGISAIRLFGLVTVVFGTVAVLGWLWLARHVHVNRFTALLIGGSWGGVEILCGYIETYMIAAALLVWVFALMVISLRKGEPSLFVPILGVLACGFSLIAVPFLPAVIAYSWRMFSGRALRPRAVLLASCGGLGLAIIVYYVTGWFRGTDVLLPLFLPRAKAVGDAVFTVRHAVDLLNALVLAAGMLTVLLIAGLFARRRITFRWNDEKLILFLALLFPMAALVMHNAQLGRARDWDIAATLLLALPVAALLAWDAIRSSVASPARIQALLAAWIFLVILPWVGVQASETRSLARFADLLKLDPEKSESGWDYLASFYFHANRVEEWAQCNFEAMKFSDNPRYHANITLYFCMKREWGNARYHARVARAAVMRDSTLSEWEAGVTDPGALISLGSSYLDRTYVADAQQTYAIAAELQPESPWPDIALADLQLRLRDFEQAHTTITDLASKGEKQISVAQAYFDGKTTKRSTDQQVAGWAGLSLIATVQGNLALADSDAQKAYELSGDERVVRFLTARHVQAAQPNP